MKTREETREKAAAMWAAFTPSEKHGIRFGLFPHGPMVAAEAEGHGSHNLACELMQCAKNDGGMRA